MKTKKTLKTESAGGEAAEAFTLMIRQCSEEGRLIAEDEILGCAASQGLLTSPPLKQDKELKKILNGILKKNKDLHALAAEDDSRRFYSSQFLTEAYAIILLQKQGNPLQLIAEVVRQNSRAYPRPVPLDIFTRPPFDLEEKEVKKFAKEMAAVKAYCDIVLIKTSTSREFLYSSLHLERAHASMLAEWLDVGQANNP
jgi:hypothetical protein